MVKSIIESDDQNDIFLSVFVAPYVPNINHCEFDVHVTIAHLLKNSAWIQIKLSFVANKF